jgi:hypothetical protein
VKAVSKQHLFNLQKHLRKWKDVCGGCTKKKGTSNETHMRQRDEKEST